MSGIQLPGDILSNMIYDSTPTSIFLIRKGLNNRINKDNELEPIWEPGYTLNGTHIAVSDNRIEYEKRRREFCKNTPE